MISFRTATGRRIDLERPRGEDIEIADIARGLSHCCRFAGQLPRFYSVAQHSVKVAQMVDPEFRLLGLLHDASEAYLGDLSRNLKHHPLLEGYRVLERQLQQVIEHRFGLHATEEARLQVKAADDLVAMLECVCLREGSLWKGMPDVQRLLDDHYVQGPIERLLPLVDRVPYQLFAWSPATGEEVFLNEFTLLRRVAV